MYSSFNFSIWISVTGILLLFLSVYLTISSGMFLLSSLSFDLNLFFIKILNCGMSFCFLISVSLITIMIFFWSLYYMPKYKLSLFYVSLVMFVFSMLLLSNSESLMVVFLGWEGLGVTSFILIIFYQNWMSAKGGLLTLLTNRLGDAILLISFCSVILLEMGDWGKSMSLSLVIILVILTLTKSAQWPFVSWLPAAMAAPTPVSSLVHSSTLVTAGVWLIIRFGFSSLMSIFLWGFLGILTLMVASLSALMETDAKKMVALSTLSQLGLMFIALAIGIPIICFSHIIMHAFAKATLFMIIGSLLHNSFSQQDSRFISSSTINTLSTLGLMISLLSLIGLTFTSGFFSKEQILFGQPSLLNSLMSFMMLIFIISLTLAYCLKLFFSITYLNPQSIYKISFSSVNQIYPIFFMSVMTMTLGFIFNYNLFFSVFFLKSLESVLWSISILGIIISFLSSTILFSVFGGFYSHSKMIDLSIYSLKSMKPNTNNLESSGSEMLFLLSGFIFMKMLKQGIRMMFMFSLISILIIIM